MENYSDSKINLAETINQSLERKGWKMLSVGGSRRRKYNEKLILYKRSRKLCEVLKQTDASNRPFSDDISESSSKTKHNTRENTNNFDARIGISTEFSGEATTISGLKSTGSFQTMGKPIVSFNPNPAFVGTDYGGARLSRFDDFESLRALRSDKDSLIIGFDSEWFGENERKMLTWQFALIQNEELLEYVFIKRNFIDAPARDNLWLELALARILDDLNSPRYERVRISNTVQYKFIYGLDPETNMPMEGISSRWEDALINGRYAYVNGKATDILLSEIAADISQFRFSDNDWSFCKRKFDKCDAPSIDITLVAHAAKADITTLYQQRACRKDVLRFLKEAGGGLFSTYPIYLNPKSVYPSGAQNYYYPIKLHIRDSICSAPANDHSLSALGKVVGISKLDLPAESKEHMDKVLLDTPDLYMEYASTDAVITLLYTAAVYGTNKHQSVTILSAGTRVMKEAISDYLETQNDADFDRVYRGLRMISHGKKRNPNRPGYIESRSLEPINYDATTLQNDSSRAFMGGYNGCSNVGFYNMLTFDYDLQNAYPTAMSLIPDISWEDCILRQFEENHILTERDFLDSSGMPDPFTLMFCYVRFEFPKDVAYPCLPINHEGVLVFTRTTDVSNGVYACGPELYLAVKLGAKVVAHKGYTVRPRYRSDGSKSFSMAYAVKQLIADRRSAKALCGKGSIEELILKLIVCGGYGKVAQNVKQKSHWSAYTGEMEDIGCSGITNPASAAMITSIIRAVLLAAQNQITELGYTVFSVTTDGFISDIPEDVLKALDLYGLRDKLSEARRFLTDGEDPEIWEMKHIQNDLLNLTTRGNVSLNTGCRPNNLPHDLTDETADEYYKNPVFALPGVCAHNGTTSGYLHDSYDDRLWLILQSLTRTKAVAYEDTEWPIFKKLVSGEPFRVRKVVRHVRMDFDMKRKPDQSSISAVYPEINGTVYEIANFRTMPFENLEEYGKYRDVKAKVPCLRTADDWETFFMKLSCNGSKAKPRDIEFSKIMSVIIGFRNGKISIPYLDEGDLSVQEKCDWISLFSGKEFKPSDWKNARRPERVSSMLPLELLESLIKRVQEASKVALEKLKDKSGTWYVPEFINELLDSILEPIVWNRTGDCRQNS